MAKSKDTDKEKKPNLKPEERQKVKDEMDEMVANGHVGDFHKEMLVRNGLGWLDSKNNSSVAATICKHAEKQCNQSMIDNGVDAHALKDKVLNGGMLGGSATKKIKIGACKILRQRVHGTCPHWMCHGNESSHSMPRLQTP